MPRVIARGDSIEFRCPGCGKVHWLNTDQRDRPAWTFDGDTERPTITPSINASIAYRDPARADQRCHSYVTAGRIRFLPDCTHALAGQTVDLPEIPKS